MGPWDHTTAPAAIDGGAYTLLGTVITAVVVPFLVWAGRRLAADYRELWALRELVEEYREAGVEIVREARLTKRAVDHAPARRPRPTRPDPGVIHLHRGERSRGRRRS